MALKLGSRDAAADYGVASSLTCEPEEHLTSDPLLGGANDGEGVFGEARHSAMDTTYPLIVGETKPAAVTTLPELKQRGREQRQTAGLRLHIGHKRVDEGGLDP